MGNNQPPKKSKGQSIKETSGMRFKERDGIILQTIYEYDGVLARRHIKYLFWHDKTTRPMERRLSKLYHAGYINWPSPEQRKTKPIPEPICWLNWKAALYIAGKSGIDVEIPTRINENQLRLLQKRLRDQGIHWLREPRWQQLVHDLTVVDFRFMLEQAIYELQVVSLEEWICERVFRSDMDKVSFNIKGKGGKIFRRSKGVIPDGYFVIVDELRRSKGEKHKIRLLFELDMATHDNPSFGIEKAAAGVAYIKSSAYKSRFGSNVGHWLIVTTGDVRRKNLMRQTYERTGNDAALFFFTTLSQLQTGNILKVPIWWQVGLSEPRSLLII